MSFSIYGGTGIIGSYYIGLYGGRPLLRDQCSPMDKEVLYLISTTSNCYEKPLVHTRTNIDCLMKRLIACKEADIKTFNFVSSWFVYGDRQDVMKESDCCSPHGLYSITKHCAEQLVIDYCSHFAIKWRIFRLGNVYGGPDASDGRRNALHYIVQELKANRCVKVVDEMSRDYIHIYDACRAMQLLSKEAPENEIYNIASGRSTLLSDCVEQCKEILKSESEIIHRKPRVGEQSQKMVLDCGKLFSAGFLPVISLEEGLHDLCTNRKFSTPVHFSMGRK
jgi:nucleoside-diphosphate-sugar epimerase